VVALHQGGITSTVATLGTATTPQHLQTLSRTTDTIIFFLMVTEQGVPLHGKRFKLHCLLSRQD